MRVLAVGAHPDDIELGCGGALAAHHAAGDEIAMLVLTTGERGPQHAVSRLYEQEEAAAILRASLIWGGFDDGAIPSGQPCVEVIERALRDFGADTVYGHVADDTHQDHRAAGLATMAATRRLSRVLLYESPTTVSFDPGFYIDVEAHLDTKLRALRAHVSQVAKNGLVDLDAIVAIARCRGFAARIHQAEAFEVGRFVWTVPAERRRNVHQAAGSTSYESSSLRSEGVEVVAVP